MQRFTFNLILSLSSLCLLVPGLNAAMLTGAGQHLPVPNQGPPANQGRSVTGNTVSGPWQGTWSAPVLNDWVGTFDANGPTPTTINNNMGTTVYDFTSLPTGALPAGTYFRFGDVDYGSGSIEVLSLTATDSNGAILTPWLHEPMAVNGTGSGPASSIISDDMPGWSYGAGSYKIDGSTVPGNPTVSFMLTNDVPITTLRLTRGTRFANFSLHAPIPEPASAGMLLAGALAFARRRSR